MKQLTGADTLFLANDTDTATGHISSLALFEMPTDGTAPIDLVRRHFQSRMGLVPPFRRRVVEVPFGIDRPYWVEDPEFNIEYHVRHVGVPPPGGMAELEQLVADIHTRPLDRRHPLWEAHVIEGLESGQFALLFKVHHAAIDGAAGVLVMNLLYTTEPETSPSQLPEAPEGEPIPTPQELLARAGWNLATRPQRMAMAQQRLWMESLGLAVQNRDRLRRPRGNSLRPGLVAPPTPFNASLSPYRSVSLGGVALSRVKGIKSAFDATVNDVVMAVCGAALRHYLIEHDALPDEPLVAGVPVSIRTGTEEDPWTNRVWALAAQLPTNIEDPVERIGVAHEAMAQGKADMELVPADALSDFSQFQSPGLAATAANVMTRMHAGDRLRSVVNVVVSNVPGPRHPLYMGTAKMQAYYPVSTIAEGLGVNITVHSYEDQLDIGIVADRKLMPDTDRLLELMVEEVEVLADAAGLPPLDDPDEDSDRRVVDRSNWPDDLDPAARNVLELTAKAIEGGQPPMWEMTPAEARNSYRTMSSLMGPGIDIHHIEDLSIRRGDGSDIGVRLYRPEEGVLPVVVFYHGGGFVIGDLESHDRECRRIAQDANAVVVSVDYGLGPERPFPSATDDAWAGLTWTLTNAERLGLDASRVAVAGDSAGGNLAAVTAQRARDEGINLCLQVLVYPAVDISEDTMDRYPSRKKFDGVTLSQDLNEWFMSHYLGDEMPDDVRLTPIRGELAGLAPALIITAACDPLRDEGEAYAKALDAAGVRTTYSDYPGQIHGFFNLGAFVPDGRVAVAEVGAALQLAFSHQATAMAGPN